MNMETNQQANEDMASAAAKTDLRADAPAAPAEDSAPDRFRRLNWDERVQRGDFVADEHQGFEPWVGPTGFRADSFVKPIYRLDGSRTIASEKSK